MKKLLSLVLAIMMVLSLMTTAFAGTFEDVDAKNVALTDAASLLSALEIITGYEDGTFKPEKVVTRAEMATMLIKAKGLASVATDTPSFKDCQNHWAKGYISLASDLGIINGRGNGVFDPDSVVTYEEAAIMMLRALGYTDESINGGKSTGFNAANYRTKALTLNLFKDFTFTAMKDGATRGNIALMLNRNLSNSIVSTNEDGRAVVEKDELGNIVKLLNSIAKKQTVTVDTKLAAKANLVDMTQYLYQSVDAYFKNDVVIFVESSNSTTVSGSVSTKTPPTATTAKIGTTVYTMDSTTIPVFYNGVASSYDALYAADLAGAKVTAVLKSDTDSKVVALVAERQTNAKLIERTYKVNSTVLDAIALPTKDGKINLAKIKVTGVVDSLEDIQVKDVVKVYESKDKSTIKLLVVRDSVEGKITKANNTLESIFVDSVGEYRDVVDNAYTDKVALTASGTFYFDEDGNIFAFDKTSGSVTNYSMVIKTTEGIILNNTIMFKNPTVKVMNAKGETTTYTIAEDAKYDLYDATGAKVLTQQQQPLYTINAAKTETILNANIAVGHMISSVTIEDEEVTKVVLQQLAPAGKDVNVESKAFNTSSNLVVFNMNGTSFKVNTLEELVAMKTIAQAKFSSIVNEKGEYSVILVNGVDVVKPTPNYALIAEQQKVINADGKITQEFVVYINGEKTTYLAKVGLADVDAGKDLVQLTINNGLVTAVTPVATPTAITVDNTVSKVTDVLSNRFKADGVWYFMDDNAPIYVVDKNETFVRIGSLSDLEGLNILIEIHHDAQNIVSNIVVKTR